MFSKVPVIILCVCVCLTGARAQTPDVRVGPVEDVTPASGPGNAPAAKKKDDKKPAAKPTPTPAAQPPAAQPSAAQSPTAAQPPAAQPPAAQSPAAAQPTPAARAAQPPPDAASGEAQTAATVPPTTTAANTGGDKSQPSNTTTDAPPRANATPAAERVAQPIGIIPPPPKYEKPAPLTVEGGPSAAAATSAPVPAAPVVVAPTAIYRVGVGDVLDIRLVNGTTRDSTLFTVMSGGLLDYPLAGDPVSVAGLTPDEIGARLSGELKRRGIYDRAQFNITVRDFASHTVLVSGLVDQPGPKVLRREAVPLYVVLAEALPRADAGRAVIITRGSGASKTVDLSDPTALNELVAAGDVINVQTRPPEFFYIGGQVGTPGQKDFHAGLTLTQSILASGGLTRDAAAKVRVTVSRQGPDGRLIVTEYELREIEVGRVPDPRLLPGDRIEVGRRR